METREMEIAPWVAQIALIRTASADARRVSSSTPAEMAGWVRTTLEAMRARFQNLGGAEVWGYEAWGRNETAPGLPIAATVAAHDALVRGPLADERHNDPFDRYFTGTNLAAAAAGVLADGSYEAIALEWRNRFQKAGW